VSDGPEPMFKKVIRCVRAHMSIEMGKFNDFIFIPEILCCSIRLHSLCQLQLVVSALFVEHTKIVMSPMTSNNAYGQCHVK
jgi:hypothetical protein